MPVDKWVLRLPVRDAITDDEGEITGVNYNMSLGRVIKSPGFIHPLQINNGIYASAPYLSQTVFTGYEINASLYWTYPSGFAVNNVDNAGISDRTTRKGRIIRPPRTIVVCHRWGWFGLDHYPMVDTFTHEDPLDGIINPYWNVYEDFNPHDLEFNINYQVDIREGLKDYCEQRNIFFFDGMRMNTSVEYNNAGWIGGPVTMTGANKSMHPARWLSGVVPRHLGIFGPEIEHTFPGEYATACDPEIAIDGQWVQTDITAGEVFFIVFVTDGCQAYHGWTSPNEGVTEPFVDTGCWADDKAYLEMMYPRMKRYGGVIVHSPKCAEFWPKWTNLSFPNWNNYHGRSQCIMDAQAHLTSAAAELEEFGWSLLMRPAVPGLPPFVDEVHEEDYDYTFTAPQITVEEILDKVYEFFGLPEV